MTATKFQSAPPVKGAIGRDGSPCGLLPVSIRAPREGGDLLATTLALAKTTFQSAPPVKGAIFYFGSFLVCLLFQSAPPVKGAIPYLPLATWRSSVSIRAPREGGDRGSLESFPAQGKKRVFREP